MTIKLKIAWILSILATALASLGLLGPGTSATFSDSATVTHEIRAGHVKLRIVAVDGQPLDPAVQGQRLSDLIKNSNADITRVLELRNDGTLAITSLFLTTNPGSDDSTPVTKALSVTVTLGKGTARTEAVRTLADWQTGPHKLAIPSILAPGDSLTVTMHTTGKLDLDLDQDQTVEPTYAFTALASE